MSRLYERFQATVGEYVAVLYEPRYRLKEVAASLKMILSCCFSDKCYGPKNNVLAVIIDVSSLQKKGLVHQTYFQKN